MTSVPRSAVVVAYDEDWPRRFEVLRAHVEPALAGVAAVVEHVGSTAVPGLAAKPVIDVDVVVAGPADARAAVEALVGAGWRHQGDLGVPGREAFTVRPGLPEHHLYVVVRNSPAHRDHVDLRDHLRAHPADAARYAAERRVRAGTPTTTVAGEPLEVLLWVSGRRDVARVDLTVA